MTRSPGYSIHIYRTFGAVAEVCSQNGFASPNDGFVGGGGISENNLCIVYRNVRIENFVQKSLYIGIIFLSAASVVVLGEKF